MNDVLNEVAERYLLDCVYGWRPGVSALDALDGVRGWLRANPDADIVRLDIQSAFEAVPRQVVIDAAGDVIGSRGITALVEDLLAAQAIATGDPERGIPRGSAVAPVLLNLALRPFHQFLADQALRNSADLVDPNDLRCPEKRQADGLWTPERDMEDSSASPTRNRDRSQAGDLPSTHLDTCRLTPASGRRECPAPYGHVPVFVYGDDVLWIVPGGREKASEQLDQAVDALEELGFKPSPKKTYVRPLKSQVEFLGIAYQSFRGRCIARPPKRKRNEMSRKVERLLREISESPPAERRRALLSLESSLNYYVAAGADLSFLGLTERIRERGLLAVEPFIEHCVGERLLTSSRES